MSTFVQELHELQEQLENLPPTLTPDILTLTPDTRELLQQPQPIWGRLLPTISCLYGYDLSKNNFTLGRDTNCDVALNNNSFVSRRLTNISKVQFKIELNQDGVVYITDLSKNGTFLNGRLIGRDNSFILQNDDEIAVSFKSLRIYVFKRIQCEKFMFLPKELRSKYYASRVIGKGNCGEVRLVFDKYKCIPFACKKIIKSHGSRKLNLPEKIENEIKIMRAVKHPFVVSIREVEEAPDAYFIIMDYLEGGTLTNLIHAVKRLTEPQVKHLLLQIAIGVEYLHKLKITHRDLKPDNILLRNDMMDDNRIKITDFGLSKMLEGDDSTANMRTVIGTPYFAAPEILDATYPTYGRKVDVWSLGVIMYYMITQQLPFVASNTVSLGRLIVRGKYSMSDPVWNEVTEQGKDLLRCMLVRDPNQRYSIEQVVKHPWFTEDRDVLDRVNDLLYTNFETQVLVSEEKEGSSNGSETEKPQPKRRKLS